MKQKQTNVVGITILHAIVKDHRTADEAFCALLEYTEQKGFKSFAYHFGKSILKHYFLDEDIDYTMYEMALFDQTDPNKEVSKKAKYIVESFNKKGSLDLFDNKLFDNKLFDKGVQGLMPSFTMQ